MLKFLDPLLLFSVLMSTNKNNYSDWVEMNILVSVIWVFPSGLYIINMKILVSFLMNVVLNLLLGNLLALNIKIFYRLLIYQTRYVPAKFCLSVTKSQVNALLYLFRKVYINHDIVYSIIVSMWLGTGFLTFIFSICYYLQIKTI